MVFTVRKRMREWFQYLGGINSSLHNGEVVPVQNCVHVRDLPSEDTVDKKAHKMNRAMVAIYHRQTGNKVSV